MKGQFDLMTGGGDLGRTSPSFMGPDPALVEGVYERRLHTAGNKADLKRGVGKDSLPQGNGELLWLGRSLPRLGSG